MDIQFEGTASLGRSMYTNIILNERLIGFISPNCPGQVWVAIYNYDGSLSHTVVRKFNSKQSKENVKEWLRELFSKCAVDDVEKTSLSPLDLYMIAEKSTVSITVD